MRLSYLQMLGFRGFRQFTRMEFASGFAVIVGSNGAGKSTVCDAVEFVLTGAIRASVDHKEKGETIRDYLWWRGSESVPEPYVELGFMTSEGLLIRARRTPAGLTVTPTTDLHELLLSGQQTLETPLSQLCRTAILRDEEITQLSVDLRETERFEFVRATIGTADFRLAEETARRVVELLKRQNDSAQREYEKQRDRAAQVTARLSQVRAQASRVPELPIAESTLNRYVDGAGDASTLLARAEREISVRRNQIDVLRRSHAQLADIGKRLDQVATDEYRANVELTEGELVKAEAEAVTAVEQAARANDALRQLEEQGSRNVSLAQLVAHGKQVGLRDGQCPLCGAAHAESDFRAHVEKVEEQIQRESSELNRAARTSTDTARRVVECTTRTERLRADLARLTSLEGSLRADFLKLAGEVSSLGFSSEAEPRAVLAGVASRIQHLQAEAVEAESASAVLAYSRAASQVFDLEREAALARDQVIAAEKTLTEVSRAHVRAKEAAQTIRRLQGELVDEQLAALSPLLVELYERLRPHVDWRKVRYVLRGDVRRMLSLEVGNGLNPNFVFSSGQRRTAGLAFLLAIYLSRNWCKLRTLMLDDPVQHVDDFRALHLTEVLATVRRAGHQVICTVEDEALAELLCRRLRSDAADQGVMIRLAYEASNGSLVTEVRRIASLDAERAGWLDPHALLRLTQAFVRIGALSRAS